MSKLYVIYGCICSGKSTYIQEHKSEDDIVIDLDYLKQALLLNNVHDEVDDEIINLLWNIRNQILNNPIKNKTYWLATTVKENNYDNFDEVEVIEIIKDKEEIYQLLENDETRPNKDEWKQKIDRWFEKNQQINNLYKWLDLFDREVK